MLQAWEEEDQHGNHHVQHQIRVAREVEDQASQQTLRHEALHGRLRAHDGQHHLVWSLANPTIRQQRGWLIWLIDS